jgi:hypothetical protein
MPGCGQMAMVLKVSLQQYSITKMEMLGKQH